MLYFYKSVFICVLSYYDLCCDYKQAFYHTTCLPAEVKKAWERSPPDFFYICIISAGFYVKSVESSKKFWINNVKRKASYVRKSHVVTNTKYLSTISWQEVTFVLSLLSWSQNYCRDSF